MPEDVALNPDASPASAGTNLTSTWLQSEIGGAAPAAGNESPIAAATAEFQSNEGPADSSMFDGVDIEALLAELEGSQESAMAQQPAPEERGPVPYERFREVNEKAKKAEQIDARLAAWQDVIADLEGQGFKSAADVRAAMENQARAQREAQVQAQYDEWAAQELIDPEVAKAQAQAEIMRLRYEESMKQVTDFMAAQKKMEAMKQYPEATRGAKLVDRMVAAGVDPVIACQIVAEQVKEVERTAQTHLASKLAAARKAPPPASSANTTRPTAGPQGAQAPGSRPSLASLLGIKTGGNTV